ncbi:SDR family NAD(P)-dependent oxidoreductase [Aquihabitans daechungensis]|uniref:SDR family NAD(P)-dependent oxidoreductase n=1 Tax=Aquihabitans daechungensis TaxID=1052257 RepID=UPI003BA3AAB0
MCLNAGVFAGGYSWETTLDDWDWVMGVNLRGMVHGIRSFVPRLIDAGQPSHVIGTASIAGVVASAASAVYCTSKFAAVGLMESLQHDLGLAGAAHVGTSVICPGMVATNIDHGDRNRPADLADATDTESSHLASDSIGQILGDGGLDPLVGPPRAGAGQGRPLLRDHPRGRPLGAPRRQRERRPPRRPRPAVPDVRVTLR